LEGKDLNLIKISNLSRHHDWIKNSDVKQFLIQDGETILAGGAIRDGIKNKPIQDYDLFFKYELSKQKAKEFFAEKGYQLVFACPQGKLFTFKKESVKVQLIAKRMYRDISDLLESFDFSICQFASVDGESFYAPKVALKDNKKNYLTLVNLEYPTATINRVGKYKQKGFYVGDAIKDIVMRLVNMNPADYDPNNDVLYID
jgi:hypothetical protein